MEQSAVPNGEEQSNLGKRKRSEEIQDHGLPSQQDNASHMDLMEDKPDPSGQVPSPTTKRSRVDSGNEVLPATEPSPDHGSYSLVLPPEILQHIFSFVDPVSIARLLSVSRLTNALLDPRKPLPVSVTGGRLRLRDQNDIWSISRRAFLSAFPRPMDNMTEQDMWRLIRGVSCHLCAKKPKGKALLLATSPWSSGPGPEGVRAIWSFRVRACGSCLESRLVKVGSPVLTQELH